MFKRTLTVGLVVVLTLMIAGTAMAADPFMETGTVVSVDVASFEMDVAGTLYTVLPPAGFDLTTLTAGDTVEVIGEVDLGVVTATSVVELAPVPFLETGAVASIGLDSFELDVAGMLYTVLPPAGFDLTTLMVGEVVEVAGEEFLGVVTATSITPTGLMAFSETGTVASVGLDSFELDVAGMLYTVMPPAGFDLTTLMVGDTVEVVGTIDSSGLVTATNIVIVTDDEEEEEVEYIKDGFYCENPEASHPVIQKIAEKNSVPYEEVLAFFCGTDEIGHHGIGEIMLAYATANSMGEGTTAADILQMREELGGWGKIWQELGLKGNKNKNTSDDSEGPEEELTIEADQGPSNNGNGNGNGKDKSNNGKGKPDHAGPPEHAKNKNKP